MSCIHLNDVIVNAIRSAATGNNVMVLLPNAAFISSVHLPRSLAVGKGYVYFRSAQAESSLRSVPVRHLIIVNQNDMEERSVLMAAERTRCYTDPVIESVTV